VTPQEREGIQKFYYSLNAGVEGGGHQEIDEQQDMDRIIDLLAQTRRAALLEAAQVIPRNWLDPLLKGVRTSSCPEIEQLLQSIKAEIYRLAQEGS
jgi:hypothetical protein